MRLSEAQIKQAITHPEAEVRHDALAYFTDSFTRDLTIMPQVIQAVEGHGWAANTNLLHLAARLPQTPATLDWAIGALRREFDVQDIAQDNLRYTLALILYQADAELLVPRREAILNLAAFPDPLRPELDEKLELHRKDWAALWAALEELGEQTLDAEGATFADERGFRRLLAALARHAEPSTQVTLDLLRRNYRGRDRELMEWLEPQIVELAGRLRLEAAVPLLLRRLEPAHQEDDDELSEAVLFALERIGGDAVTRAIAPAWWTTAPECQFGLAEVLEHIPTDLALERLLVFLARETELDLRLFLGQAILGHFDPATLDVVRPLAAGDDPDFEMERHELRDRLVTVATIAEQMFPEFAAWRQEGLPRRERAAELPWRLADDFAEETEPAVSPAPVVYQMKIALKSIKPPVWRRVRTRDCTLDHLHRIIQAAMGWDSYHLYAFEIDDVEYTNPDMNEGELDMLDATQCLLSEVVTDEGQKFTYEYDFGDGWEHQILIEKIETAPDAVAALEHPVCLTGRRACPPEDVGGPWGYAEYLQALADPDHERHDELLDWRGAFDPEAFDLEAANRALTAVDEEDEDQDEEEPDET